MRKSFVAAIIIGDTFIFLDLLTCEILNVSLSETKDVQIKFATYCNNIIENCMDQSDKNYYS